MTTTDGVVTVRPGGDLDVATTGPFRDALHLVCQEPGVQVVIDLADVTFLDSTALGVLAGAVKRARAGGGTLQLAHVSLLVAKILRLTGLDILLSLPDPDGGSGP